MKTRSRRNFLKLAGGAGAAVAVGAAALPAIANGPLTVETVVGRVAALSDEGGVLTWEIFDRYMQDLIHNRGPFSRRAVAIGEWSLEEKLASLME